MYIYIYIYKHINDTHDTTDSVTDKDLIRETAELHDGGCIVAMLLPLWICFWSTFFVRYSLERWEMFPDGYGCKNAALYMATCVQNQQTTGKDDLRDT